MMSKEEIIRIMDAPSTFGGISYDSFVIGIDTSGFEIGELVYYGIPNSELENEANQC